MDPGSQNRAQFRFISQKVLPMSGAALSELVSAALAKSDLVALRDMLRSVAKALNAYGCALWRPAQEFLGDAISSPSDLADETTLFVAAAGFVDDIRNAYHKLPLLSSATGVAIRQGWINVGDVESDERVDKHNGFVNALEIKSLCSIGISLDHHVPAAITVYRKTPGLFLAEERDLLNLLAGMIPRLYQTIHDRLSTQLLEELSATVHRAELDGTAVGKVLETIAANVSSRFHCLETSIFLQEDPRRSEDISLFSTTCAGYIRSKKYSKNDTGLTPWIFANNKTVNILDVTDFDQSRYSGLAWKDEINIVEKTRSALDEKAVLRPLPPLSFIGAPVTMGSRTLGVIRCCTIVQGSYYFSDADALVLSRVASRIGQYWSNHLGREEMEQQISSWSRFDDRLRQLNLAAHSQLTGERPDEYQLALQVLNVARACIAGADILDISLLDDGGTTVRSLVSNNNGIPFTQELLDRLPQSISADPSANALSWVYKHKKTLSWPASGNEGYVEAFPGVRAAIFSPLLTDGHFLGLLSIRSTSRAAFPPQSKSMADLLAQQFCLFHRLALTFATQKQTYEDFVHQIRSPIFQADDWVRLIDDYSGYRFDAVRGLVGKAKKVASNLQVFANLAEGRVLEASMDVMSASEMVKLLIESATDNRILWGHRRVKFTVDTESFDPRCSFQVDPDLLVQAVNDVLDNAGKYGDRGSQVTISYRSESDGRHTLLIKSRGLALSSAECELATKRGWRKPVARQRAGDGSGIGLWIVDNIMRAMSGALQIIPTDINRDTIFALIFKPARSRS